MGSLDWFACTRGRVERDGLRGCRATGPDARLLCHEHGRLPRERHTHWRLLNRNQWCQVRPRSTTPGFKKSGKTSLCCKLLPNSARHIGFSISHRGPKTHNPRTQVLYVVPHPTQTTVVPDTHALVGVLPSTTSRRSITPKRAARHMHGLTSSTAPSVGEVEVLVWPRRPTPECRTS